MPTLLYINDNNLLVQRDGQIYRSQGYAWLRGAEVLFDAEQQNSAIKNCRRSPQEINNRYWQQCEQSAISNNAAGMRHSADLIWRHLTELKQQHGLNEMILVVPSHYQSSNLQLLLGIAKSCAIDVLGLVNKSVLSLHDKLQADGNYLHLDIQLHQSVATVVTVKGGHAQLGSAEIIQNVGIHAMQDILLKSIQNNFIQNDRFDPLHYASTEQQLFDQLPNIGVQIDQVGKANVNVEYEQRVHTASVDKKQWNSVLDPLLKKLIANTSASNTKAVYFDANAAFSGGDKSASNGAGLSGLTAAGMIPLNTVSQIDSGSLVSNADASATLDYITDLPVSLELDNSDTKDDVAQSVPPAAAVQAASNKKLAGAVTHFLSAGVAFPIANSELRTDGGQLSLHMSAVGNVQNMLDQQKVFIMNDSDRRELQVNDRIGSNLADGVVTAISVADKD